MAHPSTFIMSADRIKLGNLKIAPCEIQSPAPTARTAGIIHPRGRLGSKVAICSCAMYGLAASPLLKVVLRSWDAAAVACLFRRAVNFIELFATDLEDGKYRFTVRRMTTSYRMGYISIISDGAAFGSVCVSTLAPWVYFPNTRRGGDVWPPHGRARTSPSLQLFYGLFFIRIGSVDGFFGISGSPY